MKLIQIAILSLIAGLASGQDIVVRNLPAGTYVLTVAADGAASVTTAKVATLDGAPPIAPTGSVREISAAEYNKIPEAVREAHRLPLAEKFQALAFAIRKDLISIKNADAAEDAIVKDETGDDYEAFRPWRNAYRVAINATKPVTADDLADQYSEVATGVSATALNLAKLLKLIMSILELLRLLGVLS